MTTNDDPISLDDLLLEEEIEEGEVDEVNHSGEDAVGGSSPSLTTDDDVEESLEDVIGVDVVPGKPFSLADTIEENELDRRGIDQADLDTEE